MNVPFLELVNIFVLKIFDINANCTAGSFKSGLTDFTFLIKSSVSSDLSSVIINDVNFLFILLLFNILEVLFFNLDFNVEFNGPRNV